MVTRKVIEVLASKWVNPKLKQQIIEDLKAGNKAANKYINSIFTTALNESKNAIKGLGVGLGLAGAANAAEIKPDENGKISMPKTTKAEAFGVVVGEYLKGLTLPGEEGARNRSELLKNIAFTITGAGPASKIGQQAAKPIVDKAAQIASTKGIKAAEQYIKSAVAAARNKLVKTNPQAAKKIKEASDLLKGSIEDAVIKAENIFKKDYKIASRKEMMQKFKASDDYVTGTREELEAFLKKNNYEVGTPQELDEFLLGATSKNVDNVVDKAANKGVSRLSEAEEQTFINLIRQNAEGIKNLADEVGEKKTSEIPKLLKFINEVGSIIKNSPNYIKGQFKNPGSTTAVLANLGLSAYDLYQTFKEQGTLIPEKIAANVGRVGSSFFPGNMWLKLLYGQLGYVAGDFLSEASIKKLGIKRDVSNDMEKEYEADIAFPMLDSHLPEYFEGLSGRKYHVVDDRVYSYDTGRPTTVSAAIKDLNDFYEYKSRDNESKINQVNNQISELELAVQRGYKVPQEVIDKAYADREALIVENESLPKPINLYEGQYDSTGDLTEQYRTKVVQPELDRQAVQQAETAKVQQQQQQDYQKVYETIFNKVAQDSYNELDKFYTPEALAVDYYKYSELALRGEVPHMNPQEFSNYAKLQAMKQLSGTIHERTNSLMSTLINQQQKDIENYYKATELQETARNNRAKNLAELYKIDETKRSNRANELIDMYEAESGRQTSNAAYNNSLTNMYKLEVDKQNAETARQRAENETNLLPYKQGQAIAETMYYGGMSGTPIDTILNTNQSIFGTIMPGTQEGSSKSTTQKELDRYKNFKIGE